MPRSGPRAVRKYSDEFKLTAVRLSQQPGMWVTGRRPIHPARREALKDFRVKPRSSRHRCRMLARQELPRARLAPTTVYNFDHRNCAISIAVDTTPATRLSGDSRIGKSVGITVCNSARRT